MLGEDATIEFKREMPHWDSMADEIAAFANAEGGTILIGVDENREIIGIELEKLDSVEKTVNVSPASLIFKLVYHLPSC